MKTSKRRRGVGIISKRKFVFRKKAKSFRLESIKATWTHLKETQIFSRCSG